ncbi:MAG TPA: hypothetical protein VI997_03295 [Candidatus Thermoplasmatota archaeon]|nr:hypothetical protein [Candidatus Thermoplasmatota archaeon]
MQGARRLLVVLLGLLAAPSAAAQVFQPDIEVTVDYPEGELMPVVARPGFPAEADVKVRFPVNVTYTVPPGSFAPQATQLTIALLDAPFWAAVTLRDSRFPVDVGPVPDLQGRVWTFQTEATVYAKSTAPASLPAPLSFTAVADRNPPLAEASDEAPGSISARPYVIFQAEAVAATTTVEPFGEAVVELRVANLGNHLAVAVVDVVHADAGLEAEVSPAPVLLRPNPLAFRLDDEKRTVPVTIRHRSGDGGEVLLRVRDGLETPGAIVQEQVVRLHVGVARGGEPPAAWPVLLLAGVALGAVLFRR